MFYVVFLVVGAVSCCLLCVLAWLWFLCLLVGFGIACLLVATIGLRVGLFACGVCFVGGCVRIGVLVLFLCLVFVLLLPGACLRVCSVEFVGFIVIWLVHCCLFMLLVVDLFVLLFDLRLSVGFLYDLV